MALKSWASFAVLYHGFSNFGKIPDMIIRHVCFGDVHSQEKRAAQVVIKELEVRSSGLLDTVHTLVRLRFSLRRIRQNDETQ